MSNEETGPAATPDKSHDTNKPYQERFNALLEQWRKDGCPTQVFAAEAGACINDKKIPCGARPHRAKMLPDQDGITTMSVDCVNGHSDVWKFSVPTAEIAAEAAKQAAAAGRAMADAGTIARDPLRAVVKITMDLKTMKPTIESWVPNPGLGIQLAGILQAFFFEELRKAGTSDETAGGLALPPEKKLLDRNGKPIVLS